MIDRLRRTAARRVAAAALLLLLWALPQPALLSAQTEAKPAPESGAAGLSELDLALREAAGNAEPARIAALLKQGANANSVDEHRITPLMLAVVGDPERVRMLAEKGLGDAWQKGLKKIVKAMRGDAASAAALLDGGADVNAQAKRGVTPLALAALGGKPELVTLLLERGADVNARAKRGETALMVASVAGHGPVVQLLLERGADPLAQNEDGLTAALAAVLGGHPEIVELLAKGNKKGRATF